MVSDMDSVKTSTRNAHPKNKLTRTIAKVLSLRSSSAPGNGPAVVVINGVSKPLKKESFKSSGGDEELEEDRLAKQAILAKLFAGVSTVKSGYAQIQFAQSPYDADSIQSADRAVVAELKSLSELKRCYLKKQFDPSPEISLIKAEIQEQKSLLKTYEITGKKLESQSLLKDSELVFMREKLEEAKRHNEMLEKRLTQSGQMLSVLDNLHLSGLSPSHFVIVLRQTVKSIRSFVRVLIDEMRLSGWDIDAAARAIQPGIFFRREEHKCLALESFVSGEMFDGFCHRNFHGPPPESQHQQPPHRRSQARERFFERFMDLKSAKTRDYLITKPRSSFASFCRIKYSKLVHPKMESSFTGSLETRDLVRCGEFSKIEFSEFFASFAEMAKMVWLLHCLAFSFEPEEASIFQVQRGCRFSEVYMESVAEEVFPLSSSSNDSVVESEDTQVAFTVIPGFRIGKTVIQSKVYLAQMILDR